MLYILWRTYFCYYLLKKFKSEAHNFSTFIWFHNNKWNYFQHFHKQTLNDFHLFFKKFLFVFLKNFLKKNPLKRRNKKAWIAFDKKLSWTFYVYRQWNYHFKWRSQTHRRSILKSSFKLTAANFTTVHFFLFPYLVCGFNVYFRNSLRSFWRSSVRAAIIKKREQK